MVNQSRAIIVYRDTLLPPSEVFIRSQTESLSRFKPIYTCLRRTPGTDLPEEQVHALCSNGIVGRVERVRFKVFGPRASQERLLARQKPLLMHAHFAPDGADVMPLARALGIPLLVSLHGYDVNATDDSLPRLYLLRRDRLKLNTARFICISEFIRRQALAKGFPPERTLVHYIGIDTSFFSPNISVLRLPIVLFVGRLIPAKGCEYLIRAMVHVQKVMPEARLVVIGDGANDRQLRSEAARSLHNVEFLGTQPPEQVRHWMNCARVLSVPSCVTPTSQEGFGMVFGEAQAMGLPVVSSSIGGIPEAVSDGKTGFLVPEKDPEALALKLLLLLQNQDMWARFSEAGRLRVDTLFNIRKQAVHLEKIYEGVLRERKFQGGQESMREETLETSEQVAVSGIH